MGLNAGRAKTLLFSKISRLAMGPTQFPIQLVPGASPRVKRPGRGADH